ncbi:MAG: acyl-ACP--UDP-N-acetylglucosamine O-acyltransferase [Burkholderiaceae bacterium]|nr:acyl-ACP--UDP-N-acetylglucosamine O-acyltransferase [Burkholderiaceae bacterium]
MATIHPMSIVDPRAEIADSVYIGPFCTVGPNVKIGEGTWLQSHVVVDGVTEIGRNNKIYAGAAVGIEPQDKKYAGEPTRLIIGDNNVIRENCTLSTGTIQDESVTIVGNNNLFMANVHIAHDCRIGSGTIMANNVGLAGHAHVGDDAVIGGQAGVHQFVRIGKGVMIAGGSMIRQDVMPYTMVAGHPASSMGLNLEGMKRHQYTREAMRAVREVYKIIFRGGYTVVESIEKINEFIQQLEDESAKQCCCLMRDFLQESKRGVTR